jgi:hypothetical protein
MNPERTTVLSSRSPLVVAEFVRILNSASASVPSQIKNLGIASFAIRLEHLHSKGDSFGADWVVWLRPDGCVVWQEASPYRRLSKKESARLVRLIIAN